MKNIPVFLAFDNNYIPLSSVCLTSILYNTKNFINFYIISDHINSFNKKILEESLKEKFNNFTIEFIDVNANDIFKNFETSRFWSISMYSRFLIPTLKEDIDKAIYIDADTILLDDIEKLYDEDLGDNLLGAVQEKIDLGKFKKKYYKKKYLTQEHNYFNSGVLLINCKKWREENILKKCFDTKEKFPSLSNDQDILNKVFECNYKKLDFKYNFNQNIAEYSLHTNNYNLIDNVVIRHFYIRSWKKNKCGTKNNLFFNEFWLFAKMTRFYDILLEEKRNNPLLIEKEIKLFGKITLFRIKYRKEKKIICLFKNIRLFTIE